MDRLHFRGVLEHSLSGQMQYSYFPVKLEDLASHIHYTELEEGFFRIGDILVETQYLNHTAPTIAYRISSDDATIAYVTDHEPFWNSLGGHPFTIRVTSATSSFLKMPIWSVTTPNTPVTSTGRKSVGVIARLSTSRTLRLLPTFQR